MAPAASDTPLRLPPGYHFIPNEEELIVSYLVPRILAQPLPPSDIVDVDPLSAPPPVLLKRHGRKRGQDAFFFAEGQAMSSKGSRQKRTCAGGGTWQGQTTGDAMRVRCCDMDVEWRKKSFNFHEDDKKGSTGWVMHEYAITAPPKLAASLLRVYRIRFSGHGKNAQKRKRGGQEESSSDSEGQEDVPAPAKTQRREAAVQDNSAIFVGEGLLAAQSEHVAGSSPWKGMMEDCEVVEDSDALFDALVTGDCPLQAQSDHVDSSSPRLKMAGDREAVEDNSSLFLGECPLVAQTEHVVSSSPWKRMMGDLKVVEDNSALFMGDCPSVAQSEHVLSSSSWLQMMGNRETVEDNSALFLGECPLVTQTEHVVSSFPWLKMMGNREAVEDNSALFMGECPLVAQSEHVLSSSPWLQMTWDREAVEDNSALFLGECPLAAQTKHIISSSPWLKMTGDREVVEDSAALFVGITESMGTPSGFEISTVLDCYTPPLEIPESLDFLRIDD